MKTKTPKEPLIINQDRRNAIKILGGAAIAFFIALFLDVPRKIGTTITGAQGGLPPGQSEVERLKVLHTGIGIPLWDPINWRFEVEGNIENPFSLDWEEFRALPSVIRDSNFHCVTGWTKFDNQWVRLGLRYKFGNTKLKTNESIKELEERDRLNNNP